MKRLLIPALLAVACLATAGYLAARPSGLSIPFSRLQLQGLRVQGIYPKSKVFTDEESWQRFWESHAVDSINGEPRSTPAPPKVDFKEECVAAVFLGAKPNPGYGVEISKISYSADQKRTTVYVTEYVPKWGGRYIDMVAYPVSMVAYPCQPGSVDFVATEKWR